MVKWIYRDLTGKGGVGFQIKTFNFNFLKSINRKAALLIQKVKQLKSVPPRKAALLTTASFAAIGPIYYLATNPIAQVLHPNDNPIAQTVSFLVFGSYGWIQTSAFYILGASFMALAAALFLKIKARVNWGAIAVFLIGVAFLLVAGNHTQNTGIVTISEIIHRDAAFAIVGLSPLAYFLLAPSLKAHGHRGLWIYSIIAGAIAILTLAVGLIPGATNLFLGALERILLFNGQMWGEIVCISLIWATFRPKPANFSAVVSNE